MLVEQLPSHCLSKKCQDMSFLGKSGHPEELSASHLGGQDPGCGSVYACACSSSWGAGCASDGTALATEGMRESR